MNQRIRVLVSGAAGQIGYAFLFRLASGQVFGPQTELELRLLEVEASLPMLAGVVMELDDCAFPLLKSIHYTASVYEAMDGINWAVLIGAAPRKQGMERSDLLEKNGAIFKTQGAAINRYAANDVRVFVVGNPCNTNALITMHHAPDVPQNRFYAMTALDELRAKTQLAQKAGVEVSDVSKMIIWGNHSSTQFPDFYHATLKGLPVPQVISDSAWLKDTFIPTIQQRGAAVIKARGASSAASAANAIVYSLYHLTHDTPPDDIISVSCASMGEYSVDPGLIFSFPCRQEMGVLKVIEGLTFPDAFAKEKFNITLEELRQEKAMVKTLGFLG